MSNTLHDHGNRATSQSNFRVAHRSHKRSVFQRIKETIFMLLDFDPTNTESGEAENATLFSAFAQFLYRVIWTRKIEIGGFVLVVVVGIFCYSAIVDSKSNSDAKIERRVMSSSSTPASEFQPERADVANYQR